MQNGRSWELYEVGKTKLTQFANIGDGYLLDYTEECGFTLYCFFNRIIAEELKALCEAGDFEITFTELCGCGFITLKFADVPIGDCVFDPRLYADKKEEFAFDELADDLNRGMALHIVTVDPSLGGLIVGLRQIGIGHDFSVKFIEWCRQGLEKPIAKDEYNHIVDMVFSKYTSKEIKKMATLKWHTTRGEEN